MKACIKCSLTTDDPRCDVCPSCKEPMRIVFHQDFNDILVRNLPDECSTFHMHMGHHLGCGGLIAEKADSRNGKVYVCNQCYLRLRERDLNTIHLMHHPEEFVESTNQAGLSAYERIKDRQKH